MVVGVTSLELYYSKPVHSITNGKFDAFLFLIAKTTIVSYGGDTLNPTPGKRCAGVQQALSGVGRRKFQSSFVSCALFSGRAAVHFGNFNRKTKKRGSFVHIGEVYKISANGWFDYAFCDGK